ncbi:Uncharacterised protein [Salmonella enterica subsp. enterica serovar Bovismorbificans]|uniref:Uncharacterized protein n=1 Tax=Salmonella enterica subsp. enterica serovar Bovismorbificans TaxID=58097 RepID=A0A655ETU7_SALET|nr:Uncharacterised protein [Salmonella enterica subsp. enterica serovar Bovismorbificans]CQB62317.1 Uncharacterised protein [Salmonella enterica subsp. enterica serovar Bovismorbificans]
MYQVAHIKHWRALFDDSLLYVTRVKVHQRHASIFHLS